MDSEDLVLYKGKLAGVEQSKIVSVQSVEASESGERTVFVVVWSPIRHLGPGLAYYLCLQIALAFLGPEDAASMVVHHPMSSMPFLHQFVVALKERPPTWLYVA